jgi:hypothetical protein
MGVACGESVGSREWAQPGASGGGSDPRDAPECCDAVMRLALQLTACHRSPLDVTPSPHSLPDWNGSEHRKRGGGNIGARWWEQGA